MMDAHRKGDHWYTALVPCKTTFTYMVDDVEVRNSRGYGIRLFGFQCGVLPEDEALLNVAKHICNSINSIPGNSTTVEVDRSRLFFTPARTTTWSEICGGMFALRHMQEQAGESVHDHFYEQWTELFHAHYPRGGIHPDLAMVVGAPRSQMDPALLAEAERQQRELEASFNLPEAQDDGENGLRLPEDGEE